MEEFIQPDEEKIMSAEERDALIESFIVQHSATIIPIGCPMPRTPKAKYFAKIQEKLQALSCEVPSRIKTILPAAHVFSVTKQ